MHDAAASTSFSTSTTRISAHLMRSARHAVLSREEEHDALVAVRVAHVTTWAAVHAAAGSTPNERQSFAGHMTAEDDDGSLAIALTRSPCRRVAAAASAFLRALNRIESANVRLVISVALKFRSVLAQTNFSSSAAISVDDLVGWGWPGLRRAALRHDTGRGLRFSTHAVWWLKHHMRRAIQDHSRTIRVSVHAQEKVAHLLQEVSLLVQGGLSRAAAFEAALTGHPALADLWRASAPTLHLDGLVDNSGDSHRQDEERSRLLDFVADDGSTPADEALHETGLAAAVVDRLSSLTRSQAHVIIRRMGLDGQDPALLSTIGTELGVTRERARQIEKAGLERLREVVREDGITDDGQPRRRRPALPMYRVPAGEQVALSL